MFFLLNLFCWTLTNLLGVSILLHNYADSSFSQKTTVIISRYAGFSLWDHRIKSWKDRVVVPRLVIPPYKFWALREPPTWEFPACWPTIGRSKSNQRYSSSLPIKHFPNSKFCNYLPPVFEYERKIIHLNALLFYIYLQIACPTVLNLKCFCHQFIAKLPYNATKIVGVLKT